MSEIKYVEQVFNKLHSIPEEGFKEYKTSFFIAEELRKFGFELIEKAAGTGVIATMSSGKEGPVLALRADMDALPFEINSEKVWIHACGHDANSSMTLAAAKTVAEEGIKKGSIMFVFQPAEEKGAGAKALVETGLLSDVDEMVGIHLRPSMEAKLGEATPALQTGAITHMKVRIEGLASHGAWPHKGVSAVDAGVLMANAINSIRVDPRVSHSAKITKFISGSNSFNIIPDQVDLDLDIRAQANDVMDELVGKVKAAILLAAELIGARAEITIPIQFVAAEFDEGMKADIKASIEEVLGSALDPIITPGAEDFHFFKRLLNVKTAYVGLGADVTTVLHHPDMNFDKKALQYGCDILTKMVHKRLG